MMFEGERNIEKQHLKTTSESEQAIINEIELQFPRPLPKNEIQRYYFDIIMII